MYHIFNEKQKKKTNYGRNSNINQERIGTLGEKENYKNLGILEAKTII